MYTKYRVREKINYKLRGWRCPKFCVLQIGIFFSKFENMCKLQLGMHVPTLPTLFPKKLFPFLNSSRGNVKKKWAVQHDAK